MGPSWEQDCEGRAGTLLSSLPGGPVCVQTTWYGMWSMLGESSMSHKETESFHVGGGQLLGFQKLC